MLLGGQVRSCRFSVIELAYNGYWDDVIEKKKEQIAIAKAKMG